MDHVSVRSHGAGEKNRPLPRQGNFTYRTLGCPKPLSFDLFSRKVYIYLK